MGRSLREGALDGRRFRPNILVETEVHGFPQDAWQGHDLAGGTDVGLHVVGQTQRCVMVGLTLDELPDDRRILRAVARVNAACPGVYAEVVTRGIICVGDRIQLL